MSDEEEEFNDEEVDAMEDEQEPEAEDDEDVEQDQDQEEADADADADGDEEDEDGSEEEQDGSEPGDSEEGSEEESGEDAMEEDDPQESFGSEQTKSPRGLKRIYTGDSASQEQRRSISPASTRRQLLQIEPPNCRSYAIEPVVAIPHPSPTNALAASFCMSHLLTGSDDGFIRDYDVFSACNGRTFLTAPQRSHCGLGDTMMRAGILRCWWPAATQENYDNLITSGVQSMVCHSDALWALSGQVNGEIHLYTIRHEPGRVHHTFKEHTDAVTAMALSTDEKSFFSGGEDCQVLQWDLNRGGIARRFPHPGAHITAVGLKPYYPFSLPQGDVIMSDFQSPAVSVEENPPVLQETIDENAMKASPAEIPPKSPAVDAKSEASYDPLFDDEEGNPASMQPSPKTTAPPSNAGLSLPGKPKTSTVDSINDGIPAMKHGVGLLDAVKYADFSDDLLMTASSNGSLFLWDRRVQENVGRLENNKAPPWCISACWSATGNEIIAGRRNATVDVFDVRQYGGTSMRRPRLLRTLVNPADSKTVTCVAAFPDGKHMLCASEDNIRLWNVQEAPVEGWRKKGLPPFRVIPGHHGGIVSQMLIDAGSRFMVTASGARQWSGQSTKTVLIHELRPIL